MTLGNLVALREHRLVRLLAWSGVAQTGYLLAPLGVFATSGGRDEAAVRAAITGVVAFTVLYLVLSAGTFAAVIALGRPPAVADLAGSWRRAPLATAAFVLALAGLAGLPPGLAGLFAKITVIRATLAGSAGWLAVAVALNAVIGLAYYARLGAACFGTGPAPAAVPLAGSPGPAEPPRAVGPIAALAGPARVVVAVTTGVLAVGGLVLGVWPQWVLDAATAVAGSLR
jgi:NADH-quinone oxidoreductase subunit N